MDSDYLTHPNLVRAIITDISKLVNIVLMIRSNIKVLLRKSRTK